MPCPSDQPAPALTHSEQGGETGARQEKPHLLTEAKETLNFKSFLQHLLNAQRRNARPTPVPSPALPTQQGQGQAGLEKAHEEGWEQPALVPHLGHLTAAFCSSFPTHKTGRLFTYLPQAG